MDITQSTSIKEIINHVNTTKWSSVKEMFAFLLNVCSTTGLTMTRNKWPLEESPSQKIYVFLRDGGNKPSEYYYWRLNRECKGYLLRVGKGIKLETIVIPPEHLVPIKNRAKIEKAMSMKVNYYEVLDGTTFSLYWAGEWLISSGNFFNVLIENETFIINKKVLKDCILFDLNVLNRDHTYTFTLRHPDIQILAKTPELHLQYVRRRSVIVTDTAVKVNRVQPINVSLHDIKNVIMSPIDLDLKYPFGIIIRGNGVNVIIESNLFTFVKDTFYSFSHEKDVTLALKKAYSANDNKKVLREIFAGHAAVFDQVDYDNGVLALEIYESLKGIRPTNNPSLLREVKLDLDIKGDITLEIIEDLLRSSKYGYHHQ